MSYLIDTNVLLRSAQPSHAMHTDAISATLRLKQQGERLCIIPQNIIEFWAVVTRPRSANGLGLTVQNAVQEIRQLKQFFELLPDTPAIYIEWEHLVAQYSVTGKPTHDARLVAAMRVHSLTHILTFNSGDFKRFSNVKVISPLDIK